MHFVEKVFSPDKGYSCTFRNWRATSHCRFLHGYDLVFRARFECEELNLTEEGWVVDFGNLSYTKNSLDKYFDHKTLVATDDPHRERIERLHDIGVIDMVEMPRVGCEAFAEVFHAICREQLRVLGRDRVVRIAEVSVHEHGANMAGVRRQWK